MRFWGVRKVIERQMYNQRTAPEKSYIIAAVPSPLQERIGRAPIRLFASSVRAANFDGGPEAIRQLEARLKGLANDQVFAAESWKEWRNRVQQHAPRLLVLVPHVDVSPAGEVLEIGASDTLTNAEIDETVVGSAGRVIVLLLGCETAAASVRYANFIAQFRHAKAAIVVGTIMPVRGRHAAPMAAALIELLDQVLERAVQGSNHGGCDGTGAAPLYGARPAGGSCARGIRRCRLAARNGITRCLSSRCCQHGKGIVYGSPMERLSSSRGVWFRARFVTRSAREPITSFKHRIRTS
jgi:hypothetical protein